MVGDECEGEGISIGLTAAALSISRSFKVQSSRIVVVIARYSILHRAGAGHSLSLHVCTLHTVVWLTSYSGMRDARDGDTLDLFLLQKMAVDIHRYTIGIQRDSKDTV